MSAYPYNYSANVHECEFWVSTRGGWSGTIGGVMLEAVGKEQKEVVGVAGNGWERCIAKARNRAVGSHGGTVGG